MMDTQRRSKMNKHAIILFFLLSCTLIEAKETLATRLFNKLKNNSFVKSDIAVKISKLFSRGESDPSDVIDDLVQDPYSLPDFNVTANKNVVNIKSKFQNVELRGLNRMRVESMKFNLVKVHLQVAIKIPVTTLNGTYDLKGTTLYIPVSGSGSFSMQMRDVLIHAAASLNKSENGYLQVTEIAVDIHTDEIKVHFANLGSSSWSSVYNGMLNTMSNLMFDEVKHILLNGIEDKIKTKINEQLEKLPKNLVHEQSSTLFDEILERSKVSIANNYEPFLLPDHNKQFATRVFKFNVTGQLKLYNGVVNGLSTLVRTGEIIAEYGNDSLSIEADLGFENLTSSYSWIARLMGAGPSGSASISVSSIAAHIKLRQSTKTDSSPTLDEFKITNIKHLWVDVRGLGTLDFLMEILINLISNAFKKSLVNAISGPIRNAIQNELNSAPIH